MPDDVPKDKVLITTISYGQSVPVWAQGDREILTRPSGNVRQGGELPALCDIPNDNVLLAGCDERAAVRAEHLRAAAAWQGSESGMMSYVPDNDVLAVAGCPKGPVRAEHYRAARQSIQGYMAPPAGVPENHVPVSTA